MPVTLEAIRLAKAHVLYSEEIDRLGYYDEATEVMVDVLSSLAGLEREGHVRYAIRGHSTWDDYLKSTLRGAGGGALMGVLGGPVSAGAGAAVGAVSGLATQAGGDLWHNAVNGPIAKSKALASDFAQIASQAAKILERSGGTEPAQALAGLSQQVVGGVEEALRPVLEEASKKYGLDPDASFMQTLSRPIETLRRKMDVIRASSEEGMVRSSAEQVEAPPPAIVGPQQAAVPTTPAEYQRMVQSLLESNRGIENQEQADALLRTWIERQGGRVPAEVPPVSGEMAEILPARGGRNIVIPPAGRMGRVLNFVNKGLPGYMTEAMEEQAKLRAITKFGGEAFVKLPEAAQKQFRQRAVTQAKGAQFGKGSVAFILGDWLTSKAYDAVRTNILGSVGVLNSYADDMEKIGTQISQNLNDPQFGEVGKQAAELIKKITQGLPSHGFLPSKKGPATEPQPATS